MSKKKQAKAALFTRIAGKGIAGAVALSLGGAAFASMGNLATTYGILPSDMATAQALSMFNSEVSSVYYNPAYIAEDPRGELTAGFMYARPELKANSLAANSPLMRSSKVVSKAPTSMILLGMKTDLSRLTKYNNPTYLGVMVGVEKYGGEMMSFHSEADLAGRGQFLTYGRQPLFLVLGGGTKLWRGVSVGASTRITLHANAALDANMKGFDGDTERQKMNVSAKPKIAPIASLNIKWGETLCPYGCFLSGWESAFSYRRYSNSMTGVDGNIFVNQTVQAPIPLSVKTLDAYQPDIFAGGLVFTSRGFNKHEAGSYRFGGTVELQRWSMLNKELRHDTFKRPAMMASGAERLKFKDIIVPRLGAQYWMTDNIMLSGGVAYQKTPLDSRGSVDVNYLDGDKIIAGLGATLQIDEPPIFAFPMTLNVGYQYQKIRKETFDIYSSDPDFTIRHIDRVDAYGDVHVVTGSMTLKF